MKAYLFSKNLHGYKVVSMEDAIGHVDEFYFDDTSWKIRYCVVDVGNWLEDRKVLISPAAIGGLDWRNKGLMVKLTKDQIEKSPAANTDLPVARALETQIHAHFGWEYYWPEMFAAEKDVPENKGIGDHDPHLRSTKVMTDMFVKTEAGEEVGRIEDFLIDPGQWQIVFLEINQCKTGHVIINPGLVRSIDVSTRQLRIASPW